MESEGKKQEVGETLLIILEKLDHMEKPMIIGKLFKARINGEIDLDKLLRLSSIVNKVFVHDLYKLSSYILVHPYEENVTEELFNTGLIMNQNQEFTTASYGMNEPVEPEYLLTGLGRDLLKYGMGFVF